MVRYACPASHRYLLIFLLSDGKEARAVAKEAKLIVQQTANNVDEIKCSSSPNLAVCSLLALKPTHREPVKTAPTSVALSRGSLHKSQHCPKGPTQGNRGVVLSTQYLRQMEVYWLSLVDSRKTCVPVSIIRARAF